jgi:hypothetical protein
MATDKIDELISVLQANVRQGGEGARDRLEIPGSPASDQRSNGEVRAGTSDPSSERLILAAIPDGSASVTSTGSAALAGVGSASVAEASPAGAPAGDLNRLSSEMELLRRATSQQTESLLGNTQALMDSLTSRVSGTAGAAGASSGNILTGLVGSMFGLSPIISGVISLLGAGKHDTPAPLVDFALPSAIKQDIGVQPGNSFAPLTYGDSGVAKSAPVAASQPTQINVQVQAMDSRSFMDRSDDIARAVKEAMLHSHSLNDVVVDL